MSLIPTQTEEHNVRSMGNSHVKGFLPALPALSITHKCTGHQNHPHTTSDPARSWLIAFWEKRKCLYQRSQIKKHLQSQIQKCNDKWKLEAPPFIIIVLQTRNFGLLLSFQFLKYFLKKVTCNNAGNHESLGQPCVL